VWLNRIRTCRVGSGLAAGATFIIFLSCFPAATVATGKYNLSHFLILMHFAIFFKGKFKGTLLKG